MDIARLNLSFYAGVFKRRWKAVAGITLAVSAVALAYCVLAEKTYLSEARLMPEESDQGAASPLSLITANLGLPGVAKNENSSLYKDVVRSRGFVQDLLKRKYLTSRKQEVELDAYYGLGKYGETKRYNLLSDRLSKSLKVDKASNGVVDLKLETPDPVLSSELLTAILAGLEKFFREQQDRKMEKSLEFIQAKLGEKEIEFRESSARVASFLSQNQYLDPIKAPFLYDRLEGLKRDERIHEEIYLLLYKEFEKAGIEKQKGKSPMLILDYPEPALEKERPHRKKIMAVSMIAAALLSYLLFAFLDRERFKA